MPAIEADEELRDNPEVPDHRLYDLVLAATGSKDRAERALRQRIWERNRRGERTQV
jgi:hypothetical protein